MRALVVVFSYHHKNTEAVARVIAKALGADVVAPADVTPTDLAAYDLVGFGSGIYDAKHHPSVLQLADRLPEARGKKAFIFSTCGLFAFAVSNRFIRSNHSALREKLLAKGYEVVGEFGCPGFNTNVFLRFFGGINRGRPNAADLERAKVFAENLAHIQG